MKKLWLTIILISIISLCFGGLISPVNTLADDDGIDTAIFLPTTYLQYYKLESPRAICRYDDPDGEFVAISHKNAIVVYKHEKFASIDISSITNGIENGVTVIQRHKNFLLFLFDSYIYSIDLTGFPSESWANTPVKTGIRSNYSFSIYSNTIITHTGDFISYYEIASDLTFGFALSEETPFKKVEIKDTSSILLSKNGRIYYSVIGEDGLYEYNGGATSKTQLCEAQNIRSITENISAQDENIYFSSDKGVFSIDPMRPRASNPIFEIDGYNRSEDLGNILNPYGICLVGNKLWVVDATINCVQEIDLANQNKFTDFAITTNSSAVNRLTASAKDITIDKDTIYALDSGRIVMISDIDGTNKYNRIPLDETTASAFSAGNGYVCYTANDTVKLLKITDTSQPDAQTELVKKFINLPNVKDICYSESAFYLLVNNLSGGKTEVVIYKINLDGDIIAQQILPESVFGDGMQIAVDIFGTVYFAVKTDDSNELKYSFFRYTGAETPPELLFAIPPTKEITNIQTDFDGKIYILFDDNTVACYDSDELQFEKTLTLSPNLGGISNAKSFCLSHNSKTAYFIFAGLILNSSSPTEMAISTPYDIPIAEDLDISICLNNATFATLKDGAKMFDIDIAKLDGDFFEFKDYSSSSDPKKLGKEYVAIKIDSKYTLVLCDGVSSIVRTHDIIDTFSTDGVQGKGYAIVDFDAYSLPVLSEPFLIGSIEKYTLVDIQKQVEFNGKMFFVVSNGDVYGFIPKSFIIDGISTEALDGSLYSAYVYDKNGANILSNSDEVIDVIEKKTKVIIIDRNDNGKLFIRYGDGKVGYIDEKFVISDSHKNILKSIAVILLAISLTITALYFEYRFLFKKPQT